MCENLHNERVYGKKKRKRKYLKYDKRYNIWGIKQIVKLCFFNHVYMNLVIFWIIRNENYVLMNEIEKEIKFKLRLINWCNIDDKIT